jgi:hypothetical protein
MAAVIFLVARRSLRSQRVFRDRRNSLDSFSDDEIYLFFKLGPSSDAEKKFQKICF